MTKASWNEHRTFTTGTGNKYAIHVFLIHVAYNSYTFSIRLAILFTVISMQDYSISLRLYSLLHCIILPDGYA